MAFAALGTNADSLTVPTPKSKNRFPADLCPLLSCVFAAAAVRAQTPQILERRGLCTKIT